MVTTTEILTDLPAEVLHHIFSFLPDENLLDDVVAVSHLVRNVCDVNPRWLPTIAPPVLADEVLDIRTHGKELRLHYTRYLNWYENFEDGGDDTDDDRQSPLDGFFSLAPWKRVQGGSEYPTPWLHRMVYGKPCPTTLTSKDSRRKKPETRTYFYRAANKYTRSRRREKSLFFQQRKRLSQDQFRDFETEPICPEHYENETTRRMVIQPVNIRYADGSRNIRLPDHDDEHLSGQTGICKKTLDCYFGATNVVVNPLIEHRVVNLNYHCREDLQELVDEENNAVLQVDSDVLSSLSCTLADNNTAVILLIAPHMFSRSSPDLAWFYSTYFGRCFTSPWVCSTFQFYQWYKQSLKKLQVRFARLVLYSTLLQLSTLGSLCENKHCVTLCENKHCVMNNSDSMDEMEMSSHIIMCPACIRKLQLGKFVQDPSDFLQNLFDVLQQEPFATYNRTDLQTLQSYGFGKHTNKKQAKRSRK